MYDERHADQKEIYTDLKIFLIESQLNQDEESNIQIYLQLREKIHFNPAEM